MFDKIGKNRKELYMTEETIPLDKLVKIYRRIRTKIQELTTEYETEVEALKAQQQEISNAMKGPHDGVWC